MIAEVRGNHKGNLEIAKKLIHCSGENCFAYSTSVWDLTSAKEMAALNPPLLKIPSATNQHYDLQGYLCENYAGEIYVSTGQEIVDLVNFYAERDRAQGLVVYSCTSDYSVAFEDICLFEIRNLMEKSGASVKGIDFSGNHLGTFVDVAALAVGRAMESDGKGKFTHIERHFTLGSHQERHRLRRQPRARRAASPSRDLKNVDGALAYKSKDILPVEQVQHDKLKWVKEDRPPPPAVEYPPEGQT